MEVNKIKLYKLSIKKILLKNIGRNIIATNCLFFVIKKR